MNYTKIILYILAFILLCCAGTYIYRDILHKKDIGTYIAPQKYAPVIQKTDKNGNNYVQIQQTTYSESQVKSLTDSLQKIYKKDGKIQTVVKYITRVDTISTTVPIFIDTNAIFVEDSNRYIKETFSGNLKADSGHFSIQLTNDTTSAIFLEKWHLFKKNQMQVDITHTNKLYVTTSGNSYTTELKKSMFSVGPFLGVSYSTTQKFYPVLGIGITYNLLQFGKK